MSAEATDLVEVTVRYFAAARAAAGSESEHLSVGSGTTVGELVDGLAAGNPDLDRVLLRCSFLDDGVAVRDRATPVRHGATIDVLPPFAGG